MCRLTGITPFVTGEAVRVLLRCDIFAPAAAREFLRQIPGLGWVLGDAMLVVSELVTNAVKHSSGTDEDFLSISLRREADQLRICVRDPGGGDVVVDIAEPSLEPGGMGLRIVDALSVDWGSERDQDGHRVWAKLQLAS